MSTPPPSHLLGGVDKGVRRPQHERLGEDGGLSGPQRKTTHLAPSVKIERADDTQQTEIAAATATLRSSASPPPTCTGAIGEGNHLDEDDLEPGASYTKKTPA